eukprot:6476251-Amphidinium_carterae.1
MLAGFLCLGLYAAQRAGYVEPPEAEDFREVQEKELRDLSQGESSQTTTKTAKEAVASGTVPTGTDA